MECFLFSSSMAHRRVVLQHALGTLCCSSFKQTCLVLELERNWSYTWHSIEATLNSWVAYAERIRLCFHASHGFKILLFNNPSAMNDTNKDVKGTNDQAIPQVSSQAHVTLKNTWNETGLKGCSLCKQAICHNLSLFSWQSGTWKQPTDEWHHQNWVIHSTSSGLYCSWMSYSYLSLMPV